MIERRVPLLYACEAMRRFKNFQLLARVSVRRAVAFAMSLEKCMFSEEAQHSIMQQVAYVE